MALVLDGPTVVQIARTLERDRATMPLAEAVNRRLGVESWVLRLDGTGRLCGVVVLAPPVLALPDLVPEPPPPPPAPPANPLEHVHPLPEGGPLARLVGGPGASGRQLLDIALRHDDPEIRGEAVGAAVDALLRDPALEQSVLASLGGVDDGALAQSLAGIAGEAASGLLSVVVERARGRPLGERAARIFQRLGPR